LGKKIKKKSINKISKASFDILENVGFKVPNNHVWLKLKEFGINI
jgi:trimethylamine:corrinoid methyltransferase-like protein